MAELQGRLGKEEGWAAGLKEMEKLKEGDFLFLQCAPLLTIISRFLNGNQSGNRSGTNKSELGNSWGELPATLLCRVVPRPLSYRHLTYPWPSVPTVLSWTWFLRLPLDLLQWMETEGDTKRKGILAVKLLQVRCVFLCV